MQRNHLLIEHFSCRETEKIWSGRPSRKFPSGIQNRALRKLRIIDAAKELRDLKNPPGNRFEILTGDRMGQVSIRINQKWRICFLWENGNAFNVHIVDYH